jgi:hypothetical protein
MASNKIVSFLKTPIFMAKEYLHRRPDPRFNWVFVDSSLKDRAESAVATLQREGIVMLPGYFGKKALERLTQAFGAAVENRPNPYDPDSFMNMDFIPDNPVFLEAATDALLLEIIAGYYQKPFAIGRSNACRLMPTGAYRDNSYQWHHDGRGRQVHLMILLNDLEPAGQRMSYLKGTHETYYKHYRGLAEGSRFEKDVAENSPNPDRIEEVFGVAGTVAIFDSNGLHTGNRNGNGFRDVLLYCYVSRRHWQPIRYRRDQVERLPNPFRQVVTYNPYHAFV